MGYTVIRAATVQPGDELHYGLYTARPKVLKVEEKAEGMVRIEHTYGYDEIPRTERVTVVR